MESDLQNQEGPQPHDADPQQTEPNPHPPPSMNQDVTDNNQTQPNQRKEDSYSLMQRGIRFFQSFPMSTKVLNSILITVFTGMLTYSTCQQVDIQALDQQAWIGVKQMHLTKVPTTNEQATVIITLSNPGKTPALNVVNRIKFTSEKPKSLDSLYFAPSKIENRVAPPGGYEYSTTLTIPPNDLLKEQQVTSITSGELPLYVYGTITYEDIFGESHLTRLCGIYTHDKVAPTAFRWCEEKDYNYME